MELYRLKCTTNMQGENIYDQKPPNSASDTVGTAWIRHDQGQGGKAFISTLFPILSGG